MRYLLMIMLVLSGYKVLRKASSRLSSTNQTDFNRKEDQLLQYAEWNVKNDSSKVESRLEFYPKGKISISPDGRIEGEMNKMSITRKEQKAIKSKMLGKLSLHRNTTTSKKSKTELKRVDSQKIKLNADWLVYVILFGLALVIGCRLYKRRR